MLLRLLLLPILVGALLGCDEDTPASPEGAERTFEERARLVLSDARNDLRGHGAWNTEVDPLVNEATNDLGKHWWPIVLASLAKDPTGQSRVSVSGGETEATALDLARGLIHNRPQIRNANDPNVGYLYFSPVGLGWFLTQYADLLPEEDLATAVRQSIDYPDTQASLNMFTGEGTENHMMMGRTGGLLVTQLVVERGPDDPVTGAWYEAAAHWFPQMEEYFIETARSLYDRGTGEYDSSTYYPYVAGLWAVVFENATNPVVRDSARAALDWMAATIALRIFDGVFAGPEQRGGSATAPLASNTGQLAWLWWGTPAGSGEPDWTKLDRSQLTYLALSSYRPPQPTHQLAHKNLPPAYLGRIHWESEPSYLSHGDAAIKSESKGTFYFEEDFALGSMLARPTSGWTGADSQDVLWKLVVRHPDPDRAYVLQPSIGRHPWRQVGQYKNVLIDMIHIPENADELRDQALTLISGDPDNPRAVRENSWRWKYRRDFRQRWPKDTAHPLVVSARVPSLNEFTELTLHPDLETIPETGVLSLGKTFVGITTLAVTDTGFGFRVLEVVNANEFKSPDDYAADFNERTAALDAEASNGAITFTSSRGDQINFAYQTSGYPKVVEVDWGFGATTPGGFVMMKQPPFQFPEWPGGEGYGRVSTIRVNGDLIDVTNEWPPYFGPLVEQRDRVLTVTDGVHTYVVDFSGKAPTFSNP